MGQAESRARYFPEPARLHQAASFRHKGDFSLKAPGHKVLLPIGPVLAELRMCAELWSICPESWKHQEGRKDEPTPSVVELRISLQAAHPKAWAHSGSESEIPFQPRVFSHPSSPDRSAPLKLRASVCELELWTTEKMSVVRGRCLPATPALSRALRFASQPFLLSQGLAVLHASSVVVEGKAHVFAAPSGTGKSTLASRLRNSVAKFLGDEVALLSKDRVFVHPGQMDHGDLNHSAPLAAIHLLSQGSLKVSPLPPAEAMTRLLGAAMVYSDDLAAISSLLGLMEDWLRSIPVVESRVPNSEEALGIFRELA